VLNPRHNGANDAANVGEDASPLTALGTCLREAREQRGLSITALAAQLRMGEEQLQALEQGERQQLECERRGFRAWRVNSTTVSAHLMWVVPTLRKLPSIYWRECVTGSR